MFSTRKTADLQTKQVLVSNLLEACSEAMDRAAAIETLLRNNCFPLLNSDDPDGGQDAEGRQRFLREERRLRSLRKELLGAELWLDASLLKIAAICGSQRDSLEPLGGYFLTKLDRAISDHKDAIDPHSSDAIRDLTSNHLIKDEKFPFGDLFDDREVQVFFRRMRNALSGLIQELTQ
jgi:hypothetical protein